MSANLATGIRHMTAALTVIVAPDTGKAEKALKSGSTIAGKARRVTDMRKLISKVAAKFRFNKAASASPAATNELRVRYLPPTPHSEEVPPALFAAELENIRKKRKAMNVEDLARHESPGMDHKLAGLALSGGGIRSATFNLGVIQALYRCGLFSRLDYLSTVSGGGYIGSCLSSIFATAPDDKDLLIIVEGLPEDARFSVGKPLTHNRWQLEAGSCEALKLFLPPDQQARRLTLTNQVVRKNAQEAITSENGIEAVFHVLDNNCKGLKSSTQVQNGRSALTIEIPAANRPDAASGDHWVTLSVHTEPFPFQHHLGGDESDSFKHLRDSSNYLVPRQFLATFRLPGLFIRGLIVNFAMILPFLLLAAIATTWTSGGQITKAIQAENLNIEIPERAPSEKTEAEATTTPYRYFLDVEEHLAETALMKNLTSLKANVSKCFFVSLTGVPDAIEVGPTATYYDKEWIVAGQTPEKIYFEYPAGFRSKFNISAVVWTEDMSPATCAAARSGKFTATIKNPVEALADSSFSLIKIAIFLAMAILGLYPLGQWLLNQVSPTDWHARDRITRWLCGGAILSLALFSAIQIQPVAVYYYHIMSDSQDATFGDVGELSTVIAAILTVLGSLFSGAMARRTAGVIGKIGLTILGILGPVVLWLVYLNLTRWILVENTTPGWAGALWQIADGATPVAPRTVTAIIAPPLALLGALVAWIGGALQPLLNFVHDNWRWSHHARDVVGSYAIVSLVIFVITRLFYDVNATSFHRFYRDRLSAAYLINPWRHTNSGRVFHNDGQKLSALSQDRAPYHLINTTLNIQRSKTANLRGRNGAFFVFAPQYSGSQLTGYRRTSELEEEHGDLDLGTAMAISGAAASPNMGSNTMRSLVFIMSLLNIRLGYWFPHPGNFGGKDYGHKHFRNILRLASAPFTRVTPYHLFKEMIGDLKEDGWHVNLTDGGHLENMGLYELIRRRCKLIIVSDAEADPDMIFAGLANAVRLIRIDLGVWIDIDVDQIRIDAATGHSRSHYAIGRIRYGDGDDAHGYLIYFKSSTTGDEDVHIKEYDALEPTFPQQTTADQFFDEAQFEAYRALGHHVAMSLLAAPAMTRRDMRKTDDIIAGLEELMTQEQK